MLQHFVFRLLMIPFAIIYGVGVLLFNGFYSLGVLKGLKFNIPIISVGNLTVGGAGKTPHVEYLVEWLGQYIDVAVLSRGYRRKTKGFITVNPNHDALDVGDEPIQYKRKFPETSVVVSESRAFAIPKIIGNNPSIRSIILDDGFQHRAVKPGLNILLSEYDNLFTRDYLLPVGRLREFKSGYKRADIIIITKCPNQLTQKERDRCIGQINPLKEQRIYFSKYEYGQPYDLFSVEKKIELVEHMDAILICALAHSKYLVNYLENKMNVLDVIEYEDHHYFNADNIIHLRKEWSYLKGRARAILTTEKDATRLELIRDLVEDLPIYVIPIKVKFLDSDEYLIRENISNYFLDFKV